MVKKIEIEYEEFQHWDELNASDKQLLTLAKEASQNAYAPYSRFKVGCAVILQNGEIVTGNNQENAAYPLGLCAERVAFFHAGANHHGIPIVTAAIYAESELFVVKDAVTPCGACRQAMSEYEQNQSTTIPLVMCGQNGPIIKTKSVGGLLPLHFGKSSLNLKGVE
jgi:cytidine deaminase